MVERERKGHSATVEDFAPGLTSWLQRNRQYFMILLAAAAFAVLLSKLIPFYKLALYDVIVVLHTHVQVPAGSLTESFTGHLDILRLGILSPLCFR